MAGKHWSKEEEKKLKELVSDERDISQISQILGRTENGVIVKIKRLGIQVPSAKESYDFEECGKEDATIVSVSRSIKTAEDACKYGNVDLSIWEISKKRLSSSETAMKMSDGSVKVVPLWHIRVELKRIRTKKIDEGLGKFTELIRKYSPATPVPPRKRKPKEDLIVFSPYDVHFGKRCWGAETGTDYDSDIAKQMLLNATDDTLEEYSDKSIEKILIPLGQDFFNVDNWENTTASGTSQDVDDRFQYVFNVGLYGIIGSIEKWLSVAPVDIVWVPGNHDRSTSWYLTKCLSERFHKSKHVSVDISPTKRKFVQHGTTMLVSCHGDTVKEKDFAGLIPAENPTMYSQTTWREVHCGHLHKHKLVQSVNVDQHNGLIVRRLPSLSGVDRWHYEQGYVGGTRCVESYRFSRESGLVSTYNAVARL